MDRTRSRLMQYVYNLPIKQPGEFKLEMLLNDVLKASHVVTILGPD